jgi:hypothetical protein
MVVRRESKRNRKVSERMALVDDDERKNAQMVRYVQNMPV